jgi:transcriptional antiterminator RfaH
MYWGIAQCHPQQEGRAEEHLKRKGFEIYLPRIKVSVKDRKRIAPLFPGYLFVRINSVWYPILSTIGVLRVLRNGNEEPSRIEDKIVKNIREREVRGLVKLPKPMQPGDQVRILRGTFKDHIAIYDGMSGKERERVLLELLGRKVPIDIHPDDLAALGVAP